MCKCDKGYRVFFNDNTNSIISCSNSKGRFITREFSYVGNLVNRRGIRNLFYRLTY